MNYVFAKNGKTKGKRISFIIDLEKECETLAVSAADFFRIIVDGRFVSYGPERAAEGYSKIRYVNVRGAKNIRIDVAAYNTVCTCCVLQQPFFGAEIRNGDTVVYTTEDFRCFRDLSVREGTPKISPQRGYVEYTDLRVAELVPLETEPVTAPTVIEGNGDLADYAEEPLAFFGSGDFSGFDEVLGVPWITDILEPGDFNSETEFLERTVSGYKYLDYKMENEHTGFISLDIDAKEETEIFFTFQEILIDGKWIFRRTQTSELAVVIAPAGKHSFLSFEPQSLKYLKIIYKGDAGITPHFIKLENKEADRVKVSSDADFVALFEAARNTFRQNALDIFMDCPGRERAGWLCDAYFMGKAERFFTGESKIEKAFLENYILAKPVEGAPGMLNMCYPSTHPKGRFIPNWAMWFVVELCDYLKRTGDTDFIMKARDTAYGVLHYFDKFVNEFGLLEDLESWVFVEWSDCNKDDYVSGVNYPSNILYSALLDSVAQMYSDAELALRAKAVREAVVRLSFDGEFFADNSVRRDGKLVRCDDHITETCQYYALFFGLSPTEEHARKMAEEFGPLRGEGAHPSVSPSNMFIGHYLRLLWLIERGEYKRAVSEMLGHFGKMARETGTLWEGNTPGASCNHGFASVAAALLARCTAGIVTVNSDGPVYEEGFVNETGIDVNISF